MHSGDIARLPCLILQQDLRTEARIGPAQGFLDPGREPEIHQFRESPFRSVSGAFIILTMPSSLSVRILRDGIAYLLFRMMVEREVNPLELENRITDEQLVSNFDIENIGIGVPLFQTGYLTITDMLQDGVQTFYPGLSRL